MDASQRTAAELVENAAIARDLDSRNDHLIDARREHRDLTLEDRSTLDEQLVLRHATHARGLATGEDQRGNAEHYFSSASTSSCAGVVISGPPGAR